MSEFSIKDFLIYLFKNSLFIILITIFVSFAGATYLNYFQKPVYNSYTTLVLARVEEDNVNNTITQNELLINQKLVPTYREIIKSKKVLNQVIKELSLDYSYEKLNSMISVSSVSNTELIKISVNSFRQEEPSKIATSLAETFSNIISSIYNINNVSIVEEAEYPYSPYNVDFNKHMVIVTMGGLLLGIGIIFIKFYTDNTVKSEKDIEKQLKLPIIGSIPLINEKEIDKNKENKELIVFNEPKSMVTENIKIARTNLLFSAVDKKIKTILITSSMPGEGKSFMAANIAMAFAQMKKRVLLVDCDMRKGRQHYIFNLYNRNGLSNMLVEDDTINLENHIQQTKYTNLFLITMGVIPPNPSELIGSEKFNLFLEKVKQSFDIIIFDSPPMNIVTDSLVLSKKVDKTIIVSACNKTFMSDLEESTNHILKTGGDLAGIILNMKKKNKKEYYNRYYL